MKKYIKENYANLIILISTIIFFFWQYLNSYSWDWQAFILNAKYFFANGMYFEPLRPPLTYLLMGVLSIFSWTLVPYLFIIIISLAFYYAIYKLSSLTKLNFTLMYGLSFSFVFFSFAFINGSELLSLTLFILFLTFLINDSYLTGVILGLTCLARYNFLPFGVFLFLHKSWKKIFISILSYLAVLTPWFLYNFFKFGNFFTSIADQYSNNIVFRLYMMKPFQLNTLLEITNILLPFILLGLFLIIFSKNNLFFVKGNFKKVNWNKFKIDWIILFFTIFSIYSYAGIPLKSIRYLFLLLLPIIYFASIGFNFLIDLIPKKCLFDKKLLINILMLAFIVITLLLSVQYHYSNKRIEGLTLDSIDILKEQNLSSCQIASNAWVPMSYLGMHTVPLTRNKLYDLNLGKVVVYFNYARDPGDGFEEYSAMEKYLVVNESEYMIFYKGGCMTPYPYDQTYVDMLNEDLIISGKGGVNTNPCYNMFNKTNLIEGFCNWINFKGWHYQD